MQNNLDTFNEVFYKTISKDEQPTWKINPELLSYIYDALPQDLLSDDEKIFYEYTKLCEALSWDIGYTYNRGHDITPYTSDVLLPTLESLKPGSFVTCKEISYAFAALINLRHPNAEALILKYPNHHSVLVNTDSMSVELDPFYNSIPYDDSSRAKIGFPIVPRKVFAEKRPDYVTDCIGKVSQIIGRTNTSSMAHLVMKVLDTPSSLPDSPINLHDKLVSFAESLKSKGITDQATVSFLFLHFSLCNYFGSIPKCTPMVKLPTPNSGIERIICIKDDSSQVAHDYLLFNTSDLSISPKTYSEVITMLNSGNYDLEDKADSVPSL